MENLVYFIKCDEYDGDLIFKKLKMIEELFSRSIEKGDNVLLKPNWIAPHHRYNSEEWESVITNPAIITAVIKGVVKYLKNTGRITIADGPQTDSSWSKILEKMPIAEWKRFCENNNVELKIVDLRDNEWEEKGDVITKRKKLNGDPEGSIIFNLEKKSEFIENDKNYLKYYGADYNTKETVSAHSHGKHIYRVSKSAIMADVFINLPKLKTHKKAGITCSLKNLVGINTYKNYLPHYVQGTPAMGGDQFPENKINSKIETHLLKLFKKISLSLKDYSRILIPVKKAGRIIFGETNETIRGGNWYGNDTLWRMVLDLNKILFYGDVYGNISNNRKNIKYISIVDSIIGGEGNGPEAPDPIKTNVIIAGTNPVSIDCVAAKMVGYDYRKIPSLINAFRIAKLPFTNFEYKDIKIIEGSKVVPIDNIVFNGKYKFKPHIGWIGNIEL